MLKAVIFDLDQTLADTKKAHYLALISALESYMYKRKDIDWVYGKTSEEIIRHNFPHMPSEDVQKIALLKKKKLINFIKYIRLLPNAKTLLDYLFRRKIRIVLVTNNSHAEIEELLNHLELVGLFEFTVGKEDAEPKPSRDPIVYAVERLKLPLEEIVYVGDSNTDIESAKAAGIRVIINTEVHKTDTDLGRADWAVANLSEVEKVLRSLIAEVDL